MAHSIAQDDGAEPVWPSLDRTLRLFGRESFADFAKKDRRVVGHARTALSTLMDLRTQALIAGALQAERSRIARDVHDTFAQGLAGVVAQLRLASNEGLETGPRQGGGDAGTEGDPVREALAAASSALRQLNDFVRQLRDPATALPACGADGTCDVIRVVRESLAMSIARATRTTVYFETPHEALFLSGRVVHEIAMIVSEAAANAIRHAQADTLECMIVNSSACLLVEVTDDGRGFDMSQPVSGFGLLGLHERADLIGAQLDVISGPDRGTRIVLQVPYANEVR